jgi:hypothetical protein
VWRIWAHGKKQEVSHQVLGWGHGPTAHEHKEAEIKPGNIEVPILSEGWGLSTG